MLISGNQVRLNARERKHLAALTHSSPDHIRTRTQLQHFVEAHLVNYPGRMLASYLPT